MSFPLTFSFALLGDDETDMAALEANVRSISKDGLVWGLSKLVPVGYGVKKLQMTLVITDDVSLDDLQDEIQEDEDHVQSSGEFASSPVLLRADLCLLADVVAMQKL